MGLFSSLKDRFLSKVMGDLITDLGTLPTDEFGREMSLSIRQRPGKRPHLQVKYGGRGEVQYFQIACTAEWAEQFEKVAQEMRRHAKSA